MTQTDIYNLALGHLGMNLISTADIAANLKPETKALNNVFENCRDAVFREHQWAFANRQFPLVEASEDVPIGWAYAYDMPTESCATVWSVFNEATLTNKDAQDFDTYYLPDSGTRLIVTDLDTAYAEYTYIIEDVASWDAKFCQALSYNLAASASNVLTGDLDKSIKLLTLYGVFISDMKRIDAAEKRKKKKFTSTSQGVR